jgi:putative ABC transport system permease protein
VFQDKVLERLRALPGVTAAAVTASVPLSNITPGIQTVHLEGRVGDETRALQVDPNTASDGYFESLGIPVLEGRAFQVSDGPTAPLVAVINASMAKFWTSDPVGARFLPDVPQAPGAAPPWVTVVGVVSDFHLYGPDQGIGPEYYTSYRQVPFSGGQILVRTAGDPGASVPAIKDAVHAIDAESPVAQIQTVEELRHDRLKSPGLTAALLSIFAAIALVVTLTGLAGVIGTSVSQRTREFGLRMALGASRGSVLNLVTRQGIVLVMLGLAAGAGGAYLFSHLIAKYLFATTVTDPAAYVIVAGIFLLSALAATFAPARRATTIDPLTALRTE